MTLSNKEVRFTIVTTKRAKDRLKQISLQYGVFSKDVVTVLLENFDPENYKELILETKIRPKQRRQVASLVNKLESGELTDEEVETLRLALYKKGSNVA